MEPMRRMCFQKWRLWHQSNLKNIETRLKRLWVYKPTRIETEIRIATLWECSLAWKFLKFGTFWWQFKSIKTEITFRELIMVLDDRSHGIDKQINFLGSTLERALLVSFDKSKDFKNVQNVLTLTMIKLCRCSNWQSGWALRQIWNPIHMLPKSSRQITMFNFFNLHFVF